MCGHLQQVEVGWERSRTACPLGQSYGENSRFREQCPEGRCRPVVLWGPVVFNRGQREDSLTQRNCSMLIGVTLVLCLLLTSPASLALGFSSKWVPDLRLPQLHFDFMDEILVSSPVFPAPNLTCPWLHLHSVPSVGSPGNPFPWLPSSPEVSLCFGPSPMVLLLEWLAATSAALYPHFSRSDSGAP